MFNQIVMLNLVIALMSDAYEEVMSSIIEQDTFDTNSMIIETEKKFFWKRKTWKFCTRILEKLWKWIQMKNLIAVWISD